MTARRLAGVLCATVAAWASAPLTAEAANPPPVAGKPGTAAKPAPPPAAVPPAPAPAPPAAAVAPAYDIDTPAQFMDFLFGEACIPNYDVPDKVRAYASEKRLKPITSPQALALYAGQGNGAAWEVASPLGRFVLSIRGPAQSCSVWSREAAPLAVETYFQARVEAVTKPGFEAFMDRDTVIQSAAGDMRAVLYNITEPDAYESIEMVMLSVDKAGAMFQASYQIAKVGRRVPPPGQPRPAN